MEGVVEQLALGRLALRHVAEAPDAAHAAAVHALRNGIALEHAAVVELELVEALRLGRGVELLHLPQERLGVAQLLDHVGQRTVVVPRLGDVLRDAPQLDEAAVEQGDVPHAVGGEDAVGGGLERGAEQRRRARQILRAPCEVGLVGEEQRDAVVERERADVEHPLADDVGEVHGEPRVGHAAVGERAGEGRAQGGVGELRPCDCQRLPEHRAPRPAREPLGSGIPQHHLPVAPEHEHAFVDRLDHLGEPRLRAALALEQLARLDHAQPEHDEQLREQQDDDHQLERLVRRLFGVLPADLGVHLVLLLHRQQVGPGAIEGLRAELQVVRDGDVGFALEDQRDHLVARAQVVRPVGLEPLRRRDLFRVAQAGEVLGDAARDALVGGARLVDVLHLQVRIGGRERVQHAPPRFLDVVLQPGDEIEAADEPVVELVRLTRRAAELQQAERTGAGAQQGVEHENDRGAASAHERTRPCDHCAVTSSR